MLNQKINAYLRSMKWLAYIHTIQIFFGYILAVWPNFGLNNIYMMIVLFLIFGPLLHWGIYTLNDIFDIEEDKKHPLKRKRPIASGQLSLVEGYIFSSFLIAAALIASYLVNPILVYICFLFIAINLLYSLILKKIPYMDIITNSITHPLRFYTGVIAAGVFSFHSLALFITLLSLSLCALKRKKELMENKKKSRAVLGYYTQASLTYFMAIMGMLIFLLTILSRSLNLYFGIIICILFLIIIVGYHKIKLIQRFINKLY